MSAQLGAGQRGFQTAFQDFTVNAKYGPGLFVSFAHKLESVAAHAQLKEAGNEADTALGGAVENRVTAAHVDDDRMADLLAILQFDQVLLARTATVSIVVAVAQEV